MSNNNDNWYLSYDKECIEKDFMQINFNKYDLDTTQPQFKDFSYDYPLIEEYYEFQVGVANIIGSMMTLFDPNNQDIYSRDNQWKAFVKNTQHYINCEKFYCLIFWKLNTMNQFVMNRILGFYIRFCKFLEAFQQALFKGLDEKEKKNKTLDQAKDQLNANYQALTNFIRQTSEDIDQVYIYKGYNNYQNSQESLLFQKLKTILKMFFSYTNVQIEINLKKNYSKIKLDHEILKQNELSFKTVDNYVSKLEKENVQTFQDDKKTFDSAYNKGIVDEYKKRFQSDGADQEQMEEKFMEKFKQHMQKNKKTTSASGLTTSKIN